MKKEKEIEKVIRNGNVAVLVSGGYGAGWYSWNTDKPELLFNPKIVEMVENNKQSEITEDWIEDNLGIKDVFCGGAEDLSIVWLAEGTIFTIDEYDGSESIQTTDDLTLTA